MLKANELLCGERPVYPGHPVTLALIIMHEYGSLEQALAKNSNGYPDALGNGNIPGAGGEVYSALHLLELIASGTPVLEAVAFAEERWDSGKAGGHEKNVEPGQMQANRLKATFLSKVDGWFAWRPFLAGRQGPPSFGL